MPAQNLPGFISFGDELENPISSESDNERYDIHARNILRHMIRGVPLCRENGQNYAESPLATNEIIDTLITKKDDKLLSACRKEMQNIFLNAFDFLQSDASQELKDRCELFLAYFLSSYPFMDPKTNEVVMIPTKIDGLWQKVEYHFELIDISPTKGPLSWVLEDEDRIYAYGLVTSNKKAPNHLLLMGTTYPGGQGSGFADLYNFKPMHSVGESHSFSSIGKWLYKHKDQVMIVSGHSKGATMAMIAAAKWPLFISQANCLNPAGLSEDTLNYYRPSWEKQKENRPPINVLINEGDIVPYIDRGFLPGTLITQIKSNSDQLAINFKFPSFLSFLAKSYEAHIHHFAGREKLGTLSAVNIDDINQSKLRHWLHDTKWISNWLVFPLFYTKMFFSIITRKILRFYNQNEEIINGLLFVTGLIITVALLALTGFIPIAAGALAALLLSAAGISLTAVQATLLTIAVSIFAPIILVELTSKILPLAGTILFSICSAGAVITGVIMGSIWHVIKRGAQAINNAFMNNENKDEPQEELLGSSYSTMRTDLPSGSAAKSPVQTRSIFHQEKNFLTPQVCHPERVFLPEGSPDSGTVLTNRLV